MPIAPIQKLATYHPTPKQILFHKSPHRHKLFGGAVGGGKTLTLCEEVIRLMLLYAGNRAYMCRKLLADFMISTYMILMEKTVIGPLIELGKAHHDRQRRIITLKNKSKIFYGGLDDKEGGTATAALRRIKSTEFGVIAIDEANEVTEEDFKWVDTRLRHKISNGTFPPFYVLLASNPCQNWLKRRFIDNPDPKQDIFIQSLTEDNPYNPPGYADQLRATFRSKEWEEVFIKGSWAALREPDQLIPYSALEKCVKAVPTRMGGRGGVISIDTALMGDDECVIQYWRRNQLMKQRVFPYVENSMSIVGEARHMKEIERATMYVIDSVGVGDGVAARIEEVESGSVKRIVGGSKPEEDYMSHRPHDMQPHFKNLNSQMWWYMRDMVIDRAISFPDDTDTPVLLGQLSSMKYKRMSDKMIQVEPTETYKKRTGKSPDRAVCAIYGIWGLRSAPDPSEYFGDRDEDDYEFSMREKVVVNYGMGARVRKR